MAYEKLWTVTILPFSPGGGHSKIIWKLIRASVGSPAHLRVFEIYILKSVLLTPTIENLKFLKG